MTPSRTRPLRVVPVPRVGGATRRRPGGRVPLMVAALVSAAALAACGADPGATPTTGGGSSSGGGGAGGFPVTVDHAFGATVVESAPTRVATVAWGDHEVPLALGVVPVGMSEAAWGDDDGDGVLPWVEQRLDELDAETPVLFDESDGIDVEAVAATRPDLILASYSGLTPEEYETLSKIAPTVAYPETAWSTSWQEMVRLDSTAMGLAEEGERLTADLQGEIDRLVADRPALVGGSAMVAYVDPTDLSQVDFYTTHDTRASFLAEDVGLAVPSVVARASADTDGFYTTISAERADQLADVDVVVTYGETDGSTLAALQADPLLGQVPAVRRGAVVVLEDSTPLAAAANPSPLSVDAMLPDYLDLLAAALAASGE